MALELIKLVKGSSAVAQVGSYGFFKLSADTGGGGDLTFSRVFGENTPEQISAVSAVISANNMTSAQVAETYGWNIGDTIDITLTTDEVIQMRIIGINHNPDLNEKGITLEMVNCLNTTYTMNSEKTNLGGWRDTPFRTTTLSTIKSTLPQEWQNVIVKVDKQSADNGGSSFSSVITISDDLFLLSVTEITGDNALALEGIRYEYYSTGGNKGKKVGNTPSDWWTRSPSAYSGFVAINNTGFPTNLVSTASCGISFAFCV